MESGYDENLSENIFFKTLHKSYEEVFQRAVSENWVICVPCSQSLDSYEINEWNILSHILVPTDELPDTHFISLNNEEVTICDKLVRLRNYHNVPILFTELFYSNEVRYEIFCLERPLNHHSNENRQSNPRIYFVKTLEECIDLLTTESSNELATKKLDEIINQFLFLSSKDYFQKTVEQQVAFTNNIYNRCLQIVLQDKKVKAKAKVSQMFMENIRIAVESYVLHNIYSIVMKGLISNMTEEIGQFNRALRNLASIQLQDLTVENAVLESIPRARNELSRLHSYSTVLGKLNCLKRCINLISSKQSDNLCVDELLPILVFLVVKSGITTWMAQLLYIREFNFSRSDQNQASESSFLATTLEAVITFIKSGMFFKSMYFGSTSHLRLIKPDEKLANVCSYICSRSKLFWKTNNASLLRLFQCIYEGDMDGVANELEEETKNTDSFSQLSLDTKLEFCHPLCSCDRCEKLHQSVDHQLTLLNVNSANESGCSPLHVAACYGRSTFIDWLLNRGANPNCVDFSHSTPLHCAASHGYQNAVLLLMYADAKLDARDDDGNQPLHCACMNGHVDCVKALLYFAEHTGVRLNVNATNKDGDTPLHLAVKYYYKEVAEILLNYNASVSIKNKHGRNVFELSQSLPIRDVLNEKYVSVVNLLNASPSSLKCYSSAYPEIDRRHSKTLHPHIRFVHELALAKNEYGVQPTTAEALKNVEKLFNAIRQNDLKTMRHLLGSNVGEGSALRVETMHEHSQSRSLSYKCHPLCQCENCVKDSQLPGSEDDYDDECVDDFRKIDVLSVNICNADGVTALHVACRCGNAEAIRFLLDAGAKANVRTYKQLLTPLHMACLSNQLQAVKLLLEHPHAGYDINLVDRRGNTVLHCACIAGNARLVELLLKFNPDTEVRNDRGKMPVNESEESLSYMIMQMLKSSKTVATEELLS